MLGSVSLLCPSVWTECNGCLNVELQEFWVMCNFLLKKKKNQSSMDLSLFFHVRPKMTHFVSLLEFLSCPLIATGSRHQGWRKCSSWKTKAGVWMCATGIWHTRLRTRVGIHWEIFAVHWLDHSKEPWPVWAGCGGVTASVAHQWKLRLRWCAAASLLRIYSISWRKG